MEDLISWIIIILVWFIFSFASKKKPKPAQTPKPRDASIEDLLRVLGVPVPEKPQPQLQPPPVVIKKKELEQKRSIPSFRAQPQQSIPKPIVKQPVQSYDRSSTDSEDESDDFLSSEKIQDGFVYSIILGPPKAYRWMNRYK